MLDYPTINNNMSGFQQTRGKRALEPSFLPGPYDCICARGKDAYEHAGNKRFRDLIKIHQAQYAAVSNCKYLKSKIVSTIVTTVRAASPDGGFVKRIDGVWYEVGDRTAKEKCGQAFRDGLHTLYSSSTKAKAKVRQMKRYVDYDVSAPQVLPAITIPPPIGNNCNNNNNIPQDQQSQESGASIVSDDNSMSHSCSSDMHSSSSMEDDERSPPSPDFHHAQKKRVSIEVAPEVGHLIALSMPPFQQAPGFDVFGSQTFYPTDIQDDSVSVFDDEHALDALIQESESSSYDSMEDEDDLLDGDLLDDIMQHDFCDVMGVSF